MRRREMLVFLAAFAAVLVGGAALAQVGTFDSSTTSPATVLTATAGNATTAAPATKTPTDTQEPTVPVPAMETVAGPEPPEPAIRASGPPAPRIAAPDDAGAERPELPPDKDAPQLAILFPSPGDRFEEKTIGFEGTTEPGARVFAGSYEADVDQAGNWRIILVLSPGGNHVTFQAKDLAGNVATASIEVFYDGPTPDDPETGREFTAHQKWEVVDGAAAANVYYGTTVPGSRVDVGSDYGNGSTVADGGGDWELKVEFPEAPCNRAFPVVVEGATGERTEFTMKYVCATDLEFTAHQKLRESTDPWELFYGTASPGTTIWIASDYGSVQTTAGEAGRWDAKLHFTDGLPANTPIRVVVESSDGGRAEFTFSWIATETGEIDFTANQKYGSCDAAVPFDVFWGTAAPGATISVVSPYGDGTTVAGDEGGWDLRVEFATAPVGEEFPVVVESSGGGRATFGFIRTGD